VVGGVCGWWCVWLVVCEWLGVRVWSVEVSGWGCVWLVVFEWLVEVSGWGCEWSVDVSGRWR